MGDNGLDNLTTQEKDYYELLIDCFNDGKISDTERGLLNKRKAKYELSDSRVVELEEMAKTALYSINLESLSDSEKDYYELICDMLDNGIISDDARRMLNKRKDKHGISDERATKIESLAKDNMMNSQLESFTENEKDYYELICDCFNDGKISDTERGLLNKRKVKYSISDERATEIENIARLNVCGIENNASDDSNTSTTSSETESKTIITLADIDNLLEEAEELYDNEKYEECLALCNKAIELDSSCVDAYNIKVAV